MILLKLAKQVRFGAQGFSKRNFLLRTALPHRNRFFGTSQFTMGKTALVIIAEGSEEIEAVTPIDVLRRAGVDVTVAGLTGAGPLALSRNVLVVAEKSLQDALTSAPFDVVILPGGGKGSEAFVNSEEIGALLREQEASGRLIAAICAAPTALHKHGICTGRSVTSYPAMQPKMEEGSKYSYKQDRVVIDGNLITSRGPGTSLEFSLAITAALVGQETADTVGKAMLVQ